MAHGAPGEPGADPALKTWNGLDARDNVEVQRDNLLAALKALLDQADETYPHFESPRGTANRDQARAAIGAAS